MYLGYKGKVLLNKTGTTERKSTFSIPMELVTSLHLETTERQSSKQGTKWNRVFTTHVTDIDWNPYPSISYPSNWQNVQCEAILRGRRNVEQ